MEQNLLQKLISPQLDQNYPPSLSLVIHNSPLLVPVRTAIIKFTFLKTHPSYPFQYYSPIKNASDQLYN